MKVQSSEDKQAHRKAMEEAQSNAKSQNDRIQLLEKQVIHVDTL